MTFISQAWEDGSEYTFQVNENEVENINVGDYVVMIAGVGADLNCRVYGQVTEKPAVNRLTILVEKTVMV